MSREDLIREQVKDLAEELQMRDNLDPYVAKMRAWNIMITDAVRIAEEAGVL